MIEMIPADSGVCFLLEPAADPRSLAVKPYYFIFAAFLATLRCLKNHEKICPSPPKKWPLTAFIMPSTMYWLHMPPAILPMPRNGML